MYLTLYTLFISATAFNIQWHQDEAWVRAQNSETYPLRKATLQTVTVGNYLPAGITSRSANSSVTDGIYGAGYAAGNSGTPTLLEIGYFEPYTKWTHSGWLHVADYGYSSSYIAQTNIQFQEIDSHGTVYQTISWNTLPWSYTTHHIEDLTYVWWKSGFYGQYCSGYPHCNGNGNGGGNNNNGGDTPPGQNDEFKTYGDLVVSFVVIVSNRTGLLNTGAIVTPYSVTSVLEWSGFPYKNTSHSIKLTMGILSASNTTSIESVEVPHRKRQIVGQAHRANFIDIPTYALIDQNIVNDLNVTFNLNPSDNDLGNWKLTEIVKPYLQKGGLSTHGRTAFVIFPPGANNVTYQPVMGFGRGPAVPADPSGSNDVEAEQEMLDKKQKTIIITIVSVVGGLAFLTVLILFCFIAVVKKFKNKSLKRRGNKSKQTINQDSTADSFTQQQEQDKLVISENPSSYQALA